MKLALIITLVATISCPLGWFIRDYQYWRYDHINMMPITDTEVEDLK